MTPNIILKCSHLSHWFENQGEHKPVLFDINLNVEAGQIVGLVGPSGCGKSTLLRAIVGTHLAKGGYVSTYSRSTHLEERVISPGRDRGIVYQKYTLMPFLTALKNVALGPLLDSSTIPQRCNPLWWRKHRPGQLKAAEELLCKLGLAKAIDLLPKEMSGGMQQRVAIAQAMIMKPRILLLDEPFGALDEAMREELNKMLLRLYQENIEAKDKGVSPPHTILIVTHELKEALYVGDRVIGLSQHWDWQKQYEACPGATIVYDKPAPIFHPNDPPDKYNLTQQIQDIKIALHGNKT